MGRQLAAAAILACTLGCNDWPVGECGADNVCPKPQAEGEGEGTLTEVQLPKRGISASELAIVVNDLDPLSAQIADAYALARGILDDRVVHVSLTVAAVATTEEFAAAYAAVNDALTDDVQALALAWTQPYGVGCMSITSAFAFGFDEARFCHSVVPPCLGTESVATFDSDSHAPFTDQGARIAMLLAAQTLDDANALIARGVSADATFPSGTGYLVETSDPARAVRSFAFDDIVTEWAHEGGLAMEHVVADSISGKPDVLAYFTGLVDVPDIATNTFLPGAVADHLTSYGGQIPVSGQMSILRWLEAGATASYGTVVEPCNFTAKFPDPAVYLRRIFAGEPVIEAYWKSVQMPGEGVFIGEPLAAPFGLDEVHVDAATHTLTITTNQLVPDVPYVVESADRAEGPFAHVQDVIIAARARTTITVEDATEPHYRLRPRD